MRVDLDKYHFRSTILFQSIRKEFVEEIENIARTARVKKGTVLYREGTLPKAVYGIKKGKIKIEQSNEDRQRIVYVYTKDEYFGFRPLLCREKHPVTAVALEDSEIEMYDGRKFMDIVKKAPHLSLNLMEILSFEFTVWINLITSLSHKSAKERIALILLILNEKYLINDKPAQITMSKADIASYSETSEETVVRVIGLFEKSGILANSGRKFSIINKQMLEIIAAGI